jgi:carbonic anhydrase
VKESSVKHLFKNNRQWVDKVNSDKPGFFKTLSELQNPDYLWIGCSDSRVSANELLGLDPGEVFVHRNIANQVIHTDLNCLSVIQYAVDVLKVKHIIVCGHYGCGGIESVLGGDRFGLIDNWLLHIKDTCRLHKRALLSVTDPKKRSDALCEISVIEQVVNVCNTTVMQDVWRRGQEVEVHGFIYNLSDGLLKDLNVSVKDACRYGEPL